MITKTMIFLTFLLVQGVPSQGQDFGGILRGLGMDKKDDANNSTVASGLKEALQIGTQNAVNLTGRQDGYFKHEVIKILLPEKLQAVEKGLRFAGQGDAIDEFILSMNRAAEKAAPFAKDIFWDAIKGMTFQDAQQILRGGDTAATEFFRQETTDPLTEAFSPIVEESMQEVGVTKQYNQLVGRIQSIPFMNFAGDLDLDHYVVEQALKGLFHVLGEEERKIRTNPAARVTDLLKTVFGK